MVSACSFSHSERGRLLLLLFLYLKLTTNKQTNKNTKIPTNFSLGYYYLVQRVDMLVCTHVHWIYISYVTHKHFDIHFTIRYSFCVSCLADA